jgi:hypothetical protein
MRSKALGVLGTIIVGAGVFAVVITSNMGRTVGAPGPGQVVVVNGEANPVPTTVAGSVRVMGDDVFQVDGSGGNSNDTFLEVHLAAPAATGDSGLVEIQNVSLNVNLDAGVTPPSARALIVATANGQQTVRWLPLHHQGHFPGSELYAANETVRLFTDGGSDVKIIVQSFLSPAVSLQAAIAGRTNI